MMMMMLGGVGALLLVSRAEGVKGGDVKDVCASALSRRHKSRGCLL
jgi:hypothetical protein